VIIFVMLVSTKRGWRKQWRKLSIIILGSRGVCF